MQLDISTLAENNTLTDRDLQQLYGFAFYYRTLAICRPALRRVLIYYAEQCPLLDAYLQQGLSIEQLVKHNKLQGKKALLQCWRHEIKQLCLSGQLWQIKT